MSFPFPSPRFGRRFSRWAVPLLFLFLFLVLTPAVSGAAIEARPCETGPGPHPVRILDSIVLTGARDGHELPLKIYYPEDGGPFPVIIYSHGAGGSKEGKAYLGRFWASHGFVGIFMTHYGSDTTMLDLGKPLTGPENMAVIRKMAADPRVWANRPRDVSTVIDQLADIAREHPGLKGKMDSGRIGVCGHSYGAFTTLASAGAWPLAFEQLGHRARDDRPRAFLAMSPSGTRPGQNAGSAFGGIDRPVMTMTGSRDGDLFSDRPATWRLEPFQALPPGDKYSLWLEGAHHFSFGETSDSRAGSAPGLPPVDPDHHRFIKMASLAFWDAYLKDSTRARAWLKSGAIDGLSQGRARLNWK
ncbi:MAG: acetylhydrolase [Proteobacteria bacterium]|nr:acetylhydrolase [Pseudomonadota bacterium]